MSAAGRWLATVTAVACASCAAPPAIPAGEWARVTSARGAVSLDLPPGSRPGDSFRLDAPSGEGVVFSGADPADRGSVYVTRQLVIDAEGANPDATFPRILTWSMDRLERGPGRADCTSTSVGPVEGGEFHGRLTVWSCPGGSDATETVAVSADRTVALRLDLPLPAGSDGAAVVSRILGSVDVDREAVPLEVQAGGAVLGR